MGFHCLKRRRFIHYDRPPVSGKAGKDGFYKMMETAAGQCRRVSAMASYFFLQDFRFFPTGLDRLFNP